MDDSRQAPTALHTRSPTVTLAILACAEFLGMALWFSATAVAGPLARDLAMTPGQSAWLTMAVQGGFVLGTIASAMLNLADRVRPARLFVGFRSQDSGFRIQKLEVRSQEAEARRQEAGD
jgi:hypothetical protein